MTRYRVTSEIVCLMRATFPVEADNEDEAQDLAWEVIASCPDATEKDADDKLVRWEYIETFDIETTYDEESTLLEGAA